MFGKYKARVKKGNSSITDDCLNITNFTQNFSRAETKKAMEETKIIDITGETPVEYKGIVPPRKVVIPGTYPKKFPSGEYNVPCALIIGERKASTDLKTSLNEALRENDVAV